MRFWGVRGSIPSPGPETSRFGGNTPCVEIRCGEQILIFDLGSGARNLGDHYGATGLPLDATIFVSHYHYDHLQGLPFFGPIFNPKNTLRIYGPLSGGKGVKDILSGQMVQPYFPVTAEMVFRASLEYRTVTPGEPIQLGDVKITTAELNHPGGTLGYRIEYRGRSVVYATDVEHGSELDARLDQFARGADLFICDAMYTEDEYHGRLGAPAKTGWGHSTFNAAAEAATRAKVKKLVLFHHDPTRDDAGMDKLLRQARKLRPEAVAARESMTLDV